MTSIEKLIAGIEEELEAAWQLPMSGGKVLVDTKNIMKMINEVKENLPMEIVQAKKIVQDRSEIIDRARAEAETIMKTSEEKVKQLINQNEIVKASKAQAKAIINEATDQAKSLKKSSDEYAVNIMKDLDDAVTNSLAEIRKVRSMLQNKK